jgi:hypothetical protein
MGSQTPTISASLQTISTKLGALPIEIPAEARATYGKTQYEEELAARYTIGKGKFSADRRYLSIEGTVYLLNEQSVGKWAGIYELVAPISNWSQIPAPDVPPYNRPEGPVSKPDPQAYSKGQWEIDAGSTISAVGPALILTTRLSTTTKVETNGNFDWNPDTILWISANQVITNGTGRFEGALGTKTSAVSIFLPGDQSLDTVTEVDVKTIDAFRIVPESSIDTNFKLPT